MILLLFLFCFVGYAPRFAGCHRIRRGWQVYREVCSTCHSIKFVAFRNLIGVSHSEAEVRMVGDASQRGAPAVTHPDVYSGTERDGRRESCQPSRPISFLARISARPRWLVGFVGPPVYRWVSTIVAVMTSASLPACLQVWMCGCRDDRNVAGRPPLGGVAYLQARVINLVVTLG